MSTQPRTKNDLSSDETNNYWAAYFIVSDALSLCRDKLLSQENNAEDPARGFTPAPGVIERFRPPLGPGIRLDTHVEEGSVISPYYDSLIAKLIVWDEDRPSAIERSLRALGELELRGVPTTREAALEILASDVFRSGQYSTSFLEDTQLLAVSPR